MCLSYLLMLVEFQMHNILLELIALKYVLPVLCQRVHSAFPYILNKVLKSLNVS